MALGLCVRVASVLFALAAPVAAADISGLSWGEFLASDAGSAKATSITPNNGTRLLSVSMVVEDFSANAEGEKTEATASFTGSFLVTQPAKVQLSRLHATVSGIIVKTPGSTVDLALSFGPAKSTISWADVETKSERFTRDVDMILPDGRLPSPFEVSALAFVKKPGKEGAALVTLDKITIEIGEALVGANDKKPALPEAAPALVASKN
jgi:hypothetical protein